MSLEQVRTDLSATALGSLKNFPCFAGLDDRFVKSIADICVAKSFTPGTPIIGQGEIHDYGLYFLHSGTVTVAFLHQTDNAMRRAMQNEDVELDRV